VTSAAGDRWIALEGAANVRDLGGLPAAGGRRVRPGRVLRADSLHRLTRSDTERLEALGLRTVIDLRSRAEVAALPPSPLPAGADTAWMPWRPPRSVPAIVGGIAEMSYVPLGELYEQFVEVNEDHLAAMFAVLADPERHPVIFHCYAGKDRAGIAAAILLDVLGVPDEAIVADYAASDERRGRFGELTAPEGSALGLSEAELTKVNPDLARAPAEQMVAFLRVFRARWGCGEELLRNAGLAAPQVDALRRHLLVGG